ncbi:hypothetical protein AB7C87_09975 [Natrarchaeobius sp. A-rgal3]|uniref:hypothetical protein n=1 Tax=Natrarchaeobius versutus TaxID=1679078 RepID=UPI0035109A41
MAPIDHPAVGYRLIAPITDGLGLSAEPAVTTLASLEVIEVDPASSTRATRGISSGRPTADFWSG